MDQVRRSRLLFRFLQNRSRIQFNTPSTGLEWSIPFDDAQSSSQGEIMHNEIEITRDEEYRCNHCKQDSMTVFWFNGYRIHICETCITTAFHLNMAASEQQLHTANHRQLRIEE